MPKTHPPSTNTQTKAIAPPQQAMQSPTGKLQGRKITQWISTRCTYLQTKIHNLWQKLLAAFSKRTISSPFERKIIHHTISLASPATPPIVSTAEKVPTPIHVPTPPVLSPNVAEDPVIASPTQPPEPIHTPSPLIDRVTPSPATLPQERSWKTVGKIALYTFGAGAAATAAYYAWQTLVTFFDEKAILPAKSTALMQYPNSAKGPNIDPTRQIANESHATLLESQPMCKWKSFFDGCDDAIIHSSNGSNATNLLSLSLKPYTPDDQNVNVPNNVTSQISDIVAEGSWIMPFVGFCLGSVILFAIYKLLSKSVSTATTTPTTPTTGTTDTTDTKGTADTKAKTATIMKPSRQERDVFLSTALDLLSKSNVETDLFLAIRTLLKKGDIDKTAALDTLKRYQFDFRFVPGNILQAKLDKKQIRIDPNICYLACGWTNPGKQSPEIRIFEVPSSKNQPTLSLMSDIDRYALQLGDIQKQWKHHESAVREVYNRIALMECGGRYSVFDENSSVLGDHLNKLLKDNVNKKYDRFKTIVPLIHAQLDIIEKYIMRARCVNDIEMVEKKFTTLLNQCQQFASHRNNILPYPDRINSLGVLLEGRKSELNQPPTLPGSPEKPTEDPNTSTDELIREIQAGFRKYEGTLNAAAAALDRVSESRSQLISNDQDPIDWSKYDAALECAVGLIDKRIAHLEKEEQKGTPRKGISVGTPPSSSKISRQLDLIKTKK